MYSVEMKTRRQAIQTAALGAAAVAATAPILRASAKGVTVLADRWQKAKVFTLQVADAMPADQYTSKPKPEMRGYGDLMAHIGGGNMFYFSRFKGGDIPDNLRPPKATDKESVKAYLSATFDYCLDIIKGLNDEGLDKMYAGRPNTPSLSGWDLVLNGFIHTSHHRGYAEVYLRENGITPPTYAA
jgi:uncharacterized damage-inducible protein DinB